MKNPRRKNFEVLAHFFNLTAEQWEAEEEFDKNSEVYTSLDIPGDLNIPRMKAIMMPPEEFKEYCEKLRLFLLGEYEKEKIPLGGYNTTSDRIVRDFWGLIRLDVLDPESNVLYREGDKRILKGYDNCGSSINHWFPEMLDVSVTRDGKPFSIIDQLRDSEQFHKRAYRVIIRNKPKNYDSRFESIFPKLSDSFRIVSGAQPVTNIRPSVAKWIWLNSSLEDCKDQDEIVVWDPSMGWAGRLIGFLSAMAYPDLSEKKRFIYIGTDPNEEIFPRFDKIVTYWKQRIDTPFPIDDIRITPDPRWTSRLGSKCEVYPLCMGSEDFKNTDLFKQFAGKGSIVYTSPPYFSKERYSKDKGQSFRKFSQYDNWRDGFLRPTIENAYHFLSDGKILYWNIADVNIERVRLPLEQDSIKIAEDLGFTLEDTLYQLMRSYPGRDKSDRKIKEKIEKGANFIKTEGKWSKYEPVFVFRKG